MAASQSRLGDVRAQAAACAGDQPDFIDGHGSLLYRQVVSFLSLFQQWRAQQPAITFGPILKF
jgi:hypothetical protein